MENIYLCSESADWGNGFCLELVIPLRLYMPERKLYIILILWLIGFSTSYSQEIRTEISVNFRVNSFVIEPDYLDNSERILEIVNCLQEIKADPNVKLLEVSFCGAASPEGSDQINSNLAKMRLSALEGLIREHIDVPDDIITYKYEYIPWDYLKSEVECSDLQYKDEILGILNEEPRLVDHHIPGHDVDQRVLKLKLLHGGTVWLELFQLYFSRMRNAYVVFVTTDNYEDYHPTTGHHSVLIPESIDNLRHYNCSRSHMMDAHPSQLHIYLKTNALAWITAISNMAVEVDVAPHWSINLPVYYSAWDYFKSTVKLRTLLFQPEARYWVDPSNSGFFAGAHFGVASYNFAFDSEYRFQDRNGVTPAFGAGVSLGYRIPISNNGRWNAEFSLGAGAYSLHFDVFENTPDVKDGKWLSDRKMTYVGLDQASLSFSYSFDLKRKGGRR